MTTYHLPEEATKREKAFAWGVHLYTASGVIFGLLSILAIVEEKWVTAFIWMVFAVIIDAVDGALARHFRVKDVVPQFDGALLDNIVDYFNYVLVPTFIVYQAELVPPLLLIPTISVIALSSAYQFCQTDAKTDDHFFTGFPSYWNIVIPYLLLIGASPWVGAIVLIGCAVLVFVPIKYVYPSRTVEYKTLNLVMTTLWGIVFAIGAMMYPNTPNWLMQLSFVFVAYYIGMSLYMTFKKKRELS